MRISNDCCIQTRVSVTSGRCLQCVSFHSFLASCVLGMCVWVCVCLFSVPVLTIVGHPKLPFVRSADL